jgi:aspartyl/asparaginyl-tRNA synthetase
MKYYLSLALALVLMVSCKNEKKAEIEGTNIEAAINDTSIEAVIDDASVEAKTYEISIEELIKNKEKYNNQTVRLKGEVSKYNSHIMNVNWIHIKDGTSFNGKSDVTATSTTEVKLGDTISIEGKVTLDKNFGSGYIYDILIENATVIK